MVDIEKLKEQTLKWFLETISQQTDYTFLEQYFEMVDLILETVTICR